MKTKIKLYGLIGRNINYSFSPTYFKNKFKNLNLKKYQYQIFNLENIEDFVTLINDEKTE